MYKLIIIILLLLIYTFIISKTIAKYTNVDNGKPDIKRILKNIGLILLYSITAIIIISIFLTIYNSAIPKSTSELCHNIGGWIYSCKGNSLIALLTLIPMGITIIFHHILCQNIIYDIFKQNIKIYRYIFMYIYLIVTYVLNFIFILFLFGLFISLKYELYFIELLRFCVAILPTALFAISTIIFYLKKKKKL